MDLVDYIVDFDIYKVQEKMNSISRSMCKIQSNLLLDSFHKTSSWITWNNTLNQKNWLMGTSSSEKSRPSKDLFTLTIKTTNHVHITGLYLWLDADDPVSCAEYGKKHGLLDQPGWGRLKRFPKISMRLIRAISRIDQVRASMRLIRDISG